MEASALHAPALGRRPLSVPLLRLRSDEQLVALFRAGSEDAFAAMHDRYRQRLFAYVRQMLSVASRADAEDVLQDVFVRAYGALRADERDVNLRAWLYRVAHNRCIDHLRRPTPPAGDVFEMSRTPLQDPIETAQRRDDLKRLVVDVGRLPEQQRSALLMREIDGLAYADIAVALDVTVPAVKSLLVRARVGLVEAAEARETDCTVIRRDLLGAYDRGVKASGRARRHMRECAGCREYRGALRGMRRSFAALTPALGIGPLAVAAKLLGLGGASGGAAAAGGGATAGGGVLSGSAAGLAASGAATVTATKVVAVVCTAVVATGGAVKVNDMRTQERPRPALAVSSAPSDGADAAAGMAATAAVVGVPVTEATLLRRTDRSAPVRRPPPARRAQKERADGRAAAAAPATDTDAVTAPVDGDGAEPVTGAETGGVTAPGDAGDIVDPTGEASLPSGTAGDGAADDAGDRAVPVASGGTSSGSGAESPAAATGTSGGTAPVPSPTGPSPEH